MPERRATTRPEDVHEHVARAVFDGAGPHDLTGVELEWLVSRPSDRSARLPRDDISELVGQLGRPPAGSRVTVEPGGQVELSSPPLPGSEAASAAAATDLYHLDAVCRANDLELVALGADPLRDPERIVVEPRYDAMQRYFDERNPSGRTMMCNTASLQVNVGLGDEGRRRARWELVNRIGPVLLAAFANSPFGGGAPSGWVSTRFRAWQALDPTRSAPVPIDGDPVEAFTRYALDARVMLIRDGNDYEPVTDPMTFGEWMASGHPSGWPHHDDLVYHLTTLFPPVRPRGWFELRMIDALPTPFWQIAVAAVVALVEDADAGGLAVEACRDTTGLWADAAQLGLGHPALHDAAVRVLRAAVEVIERDDLAIAGAAGDYLERYTERGRAPADDRLDAWRRDGTLFPPAFSPLPADGVPVEAPR